MAMVDVPWNWFVFKMKAYQYMVQVKKFELPTTYHFNTAEGRTSLWTDSLPPPPSLFGVKWKTNILYSERSENNGKQQKQ